MVKSGQKFNEKISIVIINWNGWKDTIECLESLFQIDYPGYQIVIVDNGSQDSSVKRIKDFINGQINIKSPFIENPTIPPQKPMIEYNLDEIKWGWSMINNDAANTPGQVILLKCDKNYGFAEGNNIGIRFSLENLSPDYVLLLNNDTFVERDFLGKLVELAENYQQIGVVGPKVCYYHQPHIINSAGVVMDWYSGTGNNQGIKQLDSGLFDATLDFDALIGVCLLIRASLFEKVGYLDNKFFLLLEETDFCLRVKKNNFRVVFHPKSKVYHKEGFSGSLRPDSLYFSSRNRLFLIKKHQPPEKKLLYILTISLRAMFDSVFFLIRGQMDFSKAIIRGHFHGLLK